MSEDIITYKDIQKKKLLSKLRRYCDYQERCHQDVSDKLQKLGATEDLSNEIISILISDGYLNEERYVSAYVNGKYRINKWGKNKIIRFLKQKSISTYLINKSLEEIDSEEYLNILVSLLKAKAKTFKAKNQYDKHHKLYSYAYRKGYESELINTVIEDLF